MTKEKTKIIDLTNRSNHSDNGIAELEKSKAHVVVEIIEYAPNAVVSKTIMKKITGNVTVSSFASGEELAEKTSPFDTYIQVIDGAAEIIIDEKTYLLRKGNGIVIPAHAPHSFNANVQFKMLSTVIKSGYE
ncbi:MAG: cupin domain-containing protein [Bacteroidia bacterium]|nr:cupin domain-containing protein [Bacteroidia bacterium]